MGGVQIEAPPLGSLLTSGGQFHNLYHKILMKGYLFICEM